MKKIIITLMLIANVAIASGDLTPKYTYLWNVPIGFRDGYVNWSYNNSREPMSLKNKGQQIIQNSMDVWSSYCNVKFNYLGLTSDWPMKLDGQNIFGWGETVPGVVAQTLPNHDLSEKFIIDADVLYNDRLITTEGLLFLVSLHEIGHVIGLYHSDKENTVMSGPPYTNYVSLLELSVDDVKGCQSIYPTFYPATAIQAKEYFRSETDQYFITSNINEQNDLENGKHSGWQFTGNTFNVWDQTNELLRPVCRFYRFPDNHFYSSNNKECLEVVSWFQDWKIETSTAFYIIPAVKGECVNNTKSVFRFFRPWGKPAHRYVLNEPDFQKMKSSGWIFEGIVFCTI